MGYVNVKQTKIFVKVVDNFEEPNGYWIWALFPTIFINCLFKILEISVKNQLPGFRLFCGFLLFFKLFYLFGGYLKNKFTPGALFITKSCIFASVILILLYHANCLQYKFSCKPQNKITGLLHKKI
jgi:hypothetical protein